MVPQSFPSRLAAIFAGELVNKGSVTLAFMYLARTLDPTAYGEVEWALSLLTVGLLVADAGLATWSVAQVASRPLDAPAMVARVGWLRLSLAVPTAVVLGVVGWLHGGRAGAALGIYAVVLLLTPFFLQYLFDGLLQSRWTALGNALRGSTFLTAVVLMVHAGSSPSRVALAEVLGAAVLALCSLVVLRGALGMAVPLGGGRHGIGALLERSWRVGASDVVWGIHSYGGLIFLGYLALPQQAAWHSASLRLLLAIHTAVFLYLSTLLPNLARHVVDDPAGWKRLVEESLSLTGWAGCAVAVVGTLGAGTILTTVFGAPFAASVPGFRAMIWVVPISWISGHIRYSLIAAHHPRKEYQARLVGAATTIVLTLALAPSLGSAGTGIALLGGIIANAVAAWALARGVLPDCAYAKSLAACAAGAVGCLALGTLLTRLAGEIPATLAAGVLMATLALVAERDHARDLMRALIAGQKAGAGADAGA